ncbi:MAG: Fumarate reductase/succinate dehydrogenase flavoprotein domain protein [candidate division TM6 bacterium GW2011_GWF2_37_49]|nr:MAG: Fumarate reductase/succinate dehydrogenase flavoprotein domain protein [candidate division TM6 bacterium GW2011_GWF2_37_49]
MAEVVVLGAGLTGLSVAYHLESHNYHDYKIFEQGCRPGGLLKTETDNGFCFDYTGHYLHISDPYFRNFLEDVAELNTNFDVINRQSSIFLLNTYLNYPFQKNLYGLPTEAVYECINGFINRKIKIKKPQNFYDWVLKYFGAGMGKHFFYPYNSKLLSYNLKKVQHSWTGRFVPQTDLKSILCGALENNSEKSVGYNHSFYYPKQGGIEFLIKSIIARLKNNINISHKVVSVDVISKTVTFENGHTEKYKYLISTIPLKHFLKFTNKSSSKNYAKQAEKLHCTSVINFNMGFNKDFICKDHWTYFPESKFPFYRIGFWHNVSQSLAPNGMTSIYGETSFIHGTKTQSQINRLAEKSIKSALAHLQISDSNLLVTKILHIEHAYVIYDEWREKNLNKLLNDLIAKQIYSSGRYGEWNYSSMQEAVISGKALAANILNNLKTLNLSQILNTQNLKNNEIKRISSKNLVA